MRVLKNEYNIEEFLLPHYFLFFFSFKTKQLQKFKFAALMKIR